MINGLHSSQLADSGIDSETAELCGLSTVERVEANSYMGTVGKEFEGLRFPYFHPVKGEFVKFSRIRMDNAVDGYKYTQPPGSGIHLYVPPILDKIDRELFQHHRDNLKIPLFIVEGEKKAIALQSRLGFGGVVVGVGGCHSWSEKKAGYSRDRRLIKDFDWFAIEDREVYLCFDSDVLTNPNVNRAERALQFALIRQKGPRVVKLLTIPPAEDGEKMGLDDWLVAVGHDWDVEFDDLCASARTRRVLAPVPVSMADFNRTEYTKREVYLGDDEVAYITDGAVSFIHAASGTGKSYFTFQLAYCMATGKDFCGINVPAPRRVLYLQAEMPDAWWQDRSLKLQEAFGGHSDNLFFINKRFPMAEEGPYKKTIVSLDIMESLVRSYRPDVVILDPLQGYYDIAESATDPNRKLMNKLTELAIKEHFAVVIVHHDRKNNTGGNMEVMRGSSTLADWSTSIFGLARASDSFTRPDGKEVFTDSPTDITVRFEKTRLANGPNPKEIRLTRLPESSFFQLAPDGAGQHSHSDEVDDW